MATFRLEDGTEVTISQLLAKLVLAVTGSPEEVAQARREALKILEEATKEKEPA